MVFWLVMLWAAIVSIPTAIGMVGAVLYALIPEPKRKWSLDKVISVSLFLGLVLCGVLLYRGNSLDDFLPDYLKTLGVFLLAGCFLLRCIVINHALDEQAGIRPWF